METKKWTKELIQEIALKYKYRNDFRINDSKAYCAARKHKWLNDVCNHMKNGKKFWTKEKVIEISQTHKNRKSFMTNDSAAYKAAFKYGWLNDIIFDIDYEFLNENNIGNRFRRLVYVYEFSDKTAYIGLTYNENKRHLQHLKNGPVFNYMNENDLQPIKKILSNGYIDVKDAMKLEIESINKYKTDGWNVLNKLNGGELGGGNIINLKNKYKNEALKYKFRCDFKKYSPYIYHAARKKKWLQEICSHMIYKYKKKREE